MPSFITMIIATSIWVYFDARAVGVRKGRIQGFGNMNPGGWFFACLLLLIVAFPFYIVKRAEFRHINSL